jgi:hypothetical protein
MEPLQFYQQSREFGEKVTIRMLDLQIEDPFSIRKYKQLPAHANINSFPTQKIVYNRELH